MRVQFARWFRWLLAGLALALPLSAEAGVGAVGAFAERPISTNVDGVQNVFTIDLDGDGDPDVLTASTEDDKIAWHENLGGFPPAYFERVVTTSADGARWVVAADLDGDDDLDLVSASTFDDTIAWYESDGAMPPTFSPGVALSPLINGAFCVQARDMDSDGDTDIVATSLFDDRVTYWENDGQSDPTFTATTLVTSGIEPRLCAIADINADEFPDILYAASGNDTVAWLRNSGTMPATFVEQVIPVAADDPFAVEAAFIDGDDAIDVLVGLRDGMKVLWLENDGADSPTFTSRDIGVDVGGAIQVAAGDIDRDGDIDVVSTASFDDEVLWFRSDGAEPPMFEEILVTNQADAVRSVVIEDFGGPRRVVVSGAFNADAVAWWEEVFVVNINTGIEYTSIDSAIGASIDGQTLAANPVYLLLEPGFGLQGKAITLQSTGAFEQPPTGTYALDADGASLESSPGSEMGLRGGVDAAPGSATSLVADSVTLARGTLRENSLVDVQAPLRLGGPPPFSADNFVSMSADGARSAIVADVDKDGDLDVIGALFDADRVEWYESDGATPPVFTTHPIGEPVLGAISVAAGDLDGDGDTDFAAAGFDESSIYWFEQFEKSPARGDFFFERRPVELEAGGARFVVVADIDNDSDMDIVSAWETDSTIAWHENDGLQPPTFTTHVITNGASQAQAVFVADLNADGDPDVLSASRGDDTVAWYENDGAVPPSFTERAISTSAPGATGVSASDIDSDGDMDAIAGLFRSDTVAWFENDGADPPSFTERVIATDADGATSVLGADIDADGDRDIAVATATNDRVTWYENDGFTPPGFAAHVVTTSADTVQSVVAADVDRDLDLDLLVASFRDDSIAWYANDGAQTTKLLPQSTLSVAGPVLVEGLLTLNHGLVDSPAGAGLIPPTILRGTGSFRGTVHSRAVVAPGGEGDTGSFSIEGDYLQRALVRGEGFVGTGDMEIDLAGAGASGIDRLEISGVALLAGGLDVDLVSPFDPPSGTSYPFLFADAGVIDEFDVAFLPGFPDNRFMRVVYDNAEERGTGGSVRLFIDVLGSPLDLANPEDFPLISDPTAAEIGDFDGQLGPDVVLTFSGASPSENGFALVLFNGGTSGATWNGFTLGAQQITVGREPSGVAVGDIDGDFDLDIAVTNKAQGTVTLLENNGFGAFTALPAPLIVGPQPSALAFGPVDGDAFDDLVVASTGNQILSIFLNSQTRDFRDPDEEIYLSGEGDYSIIFGNVDNDKDLDIVISGSGAGQIIIIGDRFDLAESENVFDSGAPPLEIQQVLAVGDGPADVATGDLNLDGFIDIVTADSLSGTVSFALGGPGGVFGTSVSLPVGVDPVSLALVDLDDDGDLDLAVVARMAPGDPSRVVRVLRNNLVNGQVQFALTEDVSVTGDPVIVLVSDVDGQAGEDLVTINFGAGAAGAESGQPLQGGVSVLQNSCAGDANKDGVVSLADIALVIERLEQDPFGDPDTNFDGQVDVRDIAFVIFRLGTCD